MTELNDSCTANLGIFINSMSSLPVMSETFTEKAEGVQGARGDYCHHIPNITSMVREVAELKFERFNATSIGA